MARQPDGPPPPPVVQRLRLRYAKRGRLRFTSHRDFARAFERALRRAEVPMGYSAGFSPHPKISYVGASPTGVASEAEYLEIGVAVECDPEQVRLALDGCLPPGLDILECIVAAGGSLADEITGSRWEITLPGVSEGQLRAAATAFLAAESVPVERVTTKGVRVLDPRAAVVTIEVSRTAADAPPGDGTGSGDPCAILSVVVRQESPVVRPDDVIAALAAVADCAPTAPVRAVRLAQGRLDDAGRLSDPLAPDRAAVLAAREDSPAALDVVQR